MEELQKLLQIGDRQISVENEFCKRFDDVYVNFINLPKGIGGAGGGAEAENNRISFWIHGFDKKDPDALPPFGKVKVEMANSALPRNYRLRGKTAAPSVIVKYLADFLNKIVQEVEPKYTHTEQTS